jgi:outer membrane protein TolC
MPMTTLGFMVSQALPYAGKRDLRAGLATSQARQAEPSLARARLTLEAAVRRAYYGLVLARELQGLTSDQRELWQQIEVVARARYAVGQGAQPDVLRVQTEVTRIELRAIEQAAEADVRLAELNRLLARPLGTPIATPGKLGLAPIAASADDVLADARSVSPELRGAALVIETNTAAAALARRDLKPDFSIQGGYMNRGGLDAMWLAGVGMTWPFNKKARESAVAEAEIRAKGGGHVVESVGLQLAYRTRERYTRAKAIEKLVALYDGGIVPQDQMTVEASLANYQTGKVPFVSVLEAMTALFADRWARAGMVADHAKLRASLREASLDAGGEMSAASASAPAAAPAGTTGGMPAGMNGK